MTDAKTDGLSMRVSVRLKARLRRLAEKNNRKLSDYCVLKLQEAADREERDASRDRSAA